MMRRYTRDEKVTVRDKKLEVKINKTLGFIKKLTLFSGLPDEEILNFLNSAKLKNYKKGSNLYLQGMRAESFFIICNGWIKLSHATEEGDEVILAMLTRSSITGESALFEEGRYAANAQVVEAAQVLVFPLNLLSEWLRVNNKLALNMLTLMVQYQRMHELHLEQYLLYSAPQRIGCFLLGLCPVLDQQDGVIIDLPYDKTLIASALGMKGSTFSRALNILRNETDVKITGTRVKIECVKRLLEFVNGCYSYPSKIKPI